MEKKNNSNELDYQVLDYTDMIVKKIINRNITRAYWIMQGQGGYYKESQRELENLNFPVTYHDFREEASLESALIYCEAVNSYDPEHLINTGKGDSKIKFTTWLYWKLRDLDSRMWRILSNGTKHLNDYLDVGKVSADRFEDEFIFRDSLSDIGKEVLAMLETGKGFKIKKSREYDKVNCHMGARNFWESFIRDDKEKDITLHGFLTAWQEIKKAWNEIETDNIIYTITDKESA